MINIKPKAIQLYPNKCKHVRHFIDKRKTNDQYKTQIYTVIPKQVQTC